MTLYDIMQYAIAGAAILEDNPRQIQGDILDAMSVFEDLWPVNINDIQMSRAPFCDGNEPEDLGSYDWDS